jgi:ABC-2 type transport system permease protein
MVELLVGLKLRLLRRSLAGPGMRRGVVAVVVVVSLLFTGPVCLALVLLAGTGVLLANAVTVLVGFSVMLAWVWLPLFVTGTDDALSPSRFALLPVPAARLLPGLYVAGLLGLGPLLTALIGASALIGWARGPAVLLAALVGVLLGVVTATLIPHALTSALAGVLGSRRFRDVTGLALVGFAVISTVVLQLASSAVTRADGPASLLAALGHTAAVLSWTPFGAAWALPGDVARGDVAAALGHAAVAVATLCVLVVGWWLALRRALTMPLEVPDIVGRVPRDGLVDRWLSGSATGVVAGRLLRYYRRDPRRSLSLFSMMMAPVLVGVSIAGVTAAGGRGTVISLLIVAPFLGTLLGPTLAFDISYDDSALWTHLTTSVKGWEDRLGRLVGFSLLALPIVALVLALGVLATGVQHLLPFGAATIAVTGAALGVGSHLGSIVQVPVPPAGSSPFGKGSGGGPLSLVVSIVTVILALLVSTPALVVAALAYSHQWARYAALPVALLTAAAAIVWGVVMGGRRLDGRWPEVLREVTYRR